MSWFFFTLLAIACRGSYGVFSKTMSRSVDVSSAGHSILLLAVCFPIGLLASPLIGGFSTEGVRSELGPLLLMMTSSTIGGFLYFKGLQRLDAGIAQIAFSSILAWGTTFSVVVLGSHFSYRQLGGALLLMLAIWLAQYERGERVNSGIFLMLASAACFAGFQVTSAEVSKYITGGTYVLFGYLGTALLTLLLLARPIKRDLVRLKGRWLSAIRSTFAASATSVAYYVAAFLAYRSAPDPGVVVLLLTTQVILGLILAMIFLGEKRHLKRTLLAGLLSVIAGVAIKA